MILDLIWFEIMLFLGLSWGGAIFWGFKKKQINLY